MGKIPLVLMLLSYPSQIVAQSVGADTHAAYSMYFLLAVSFCTNTKLQAMNEAY